MLQLPLYQPKPNFGFFNSTVSLNSTAVWFILALVGMAFIIISSILLYHWKKYGFETAVMARAVIIYFLVAGVLLGTTAVSLAIYLRSI